MEWTIKYQPKTTKDYVGIKSNLSIVSNFLESFIDGNPIKKGLVLYGDPGNGKTSLLYALEETYNLNIIEVNASDKRNTKDIKNLINLTGIETFDDEFTVLLLDEFDGVGAWSTVEILLEQSQCPIIMTCNHISKIPYEVINECLPLAIHRPPDYLIISRLDAILLQELKQNKKIDKRICKKETLQEIAEKCTSMRSAVLTLQECVLTNTVKVVPHDIDFAEEQQIKNIFNGVDAYSDVSPEQIFKWAKSNDVPTHDLQKLLIYAREYPNMQDIVKSYSKTLRGQIDRLKSPYYQKFKKSTKAKKKEAPKKKFIERADKPKVVERRVIIKQENLDGDDLW